MRAVEIQSLLNKLVQYSCNVFKDKLVGIYLHGSLAMGCFNPVKSDIDILIVIDDEITNMEKKNFMDFIIQLNDKLPSKGIELSIVKREYCKNFIYPTPYELHFSNMYLRWYRDNPIEYIEKMKGTDKDLAAHFVVTKKRGIILYGKDIEDVFGDVPHEAYFDSIKNDIVDSENQVIDNPTYVILNLCRVLAYVKDGLVLSKKEGGEWAIKNISNDKYVGLIKDALICYQSDKDIDLNNSLALEFCKFMKEEIGIFE